MNAFERIARRLGGHPDEAGQGAQVAPRGRHRLAFFVAAVALVAVAVAATAWLGLRPGVAPGLQPGVAPGPGSSVAPTATSGDLLPAYRTGGGGMLAIATGLLRAENGCLYLDAGGQRAVVIWPPATRLRGGDVLDASGRVVARIDDLVTLAGGWYGETKYGDLAAMLCVPVPPQCRTAQFFGASAVGPGAADAISSYPVIEGGTSFDDARCVGPVQAYGAGQPDWGEMYVMGDGVYANFTGRAASHVADLRRLVAADCAVFVRIVPLSSVEGRALQERITADDTALRAAGVRLTFVGFDPVSDRVQVGAYPLTDAVRSELERRYGAANLFIIEREAASGT